VLSNDGHQISLRIAEQLNPSGAADAPLFANKVLEGPLSRASTCSPAPGVFAVGDSVFASFVMGDECSVNESECDPNTILAYPWLWPWGDTIAITPSTILTVADAVTLSDRTTCDERFPPPPAPPCDDTVGDEAGSCSLSGVGANRRRPQGALVALIVFAGALRRRRRRARCFRR
jgi:MYXO-CTERM domain-containing protein